MKLPPLPPMSGPIKFDYRLNDTQTEGEIYYYTKEQMLEFQASTVEACAVETESWDTAMTDRMAFNLRAMLKEKTKRERNDHDYN